MAAIDLDSLSETSPLDDLRRGVFHYLRDDAPSGFSSWPSPGQRERAERFVARALEIAAMNPKVLATCDIDGNSPLHWLARYPFPDAVERMVQLGADPAAKAFSSGTTPAHVAAAFNRADTLACLLRLRPSPLDETGATPLHWAAMNQARQAMRQCLELGFDPSAPDKFGYTPLHKICEGRKTLRALPAMIDLLEAGSNPSALNQDGLTPLLVAILHRSELADPLAAWIEERAILQASEPAELRRKPSL